MAQADYTRTGGTSGRTGQGGYVIDMDEDDLENAPSFRHGERPWQNRDYSRYVYGYYGVPF